MNEFELSDVEAQLNDLLDQKKLSARRGAAENKLKDLTSDDILLMKKMCKTDLFFLSNGPLGYSKLSVNLHGNYTNWLQSTWGSRYRFTLFPRGHYKSTVNTISDSIQMALPNVADVQAHPYNLGPNVKLLIGHEVRESAAKFLFEISAAFLYKPLMLALWPECIPQKGPQRVNKWELDLPGREYHKEATFNTIGAGGAAQGNHYNWLKLDDLIGEKARDSPTIMESTITWFDNIISLLTDEKDGFDLTGTRWSYADVYSHALKTYGIDLPKSVVNCLSKKDIELHAKGLLQCYARGVLENGLPIFPELMTPEKIRVLRKNRLIWAAQYVNNPQEAGMTEFDYPLKFYNTTVDNKIVVFTGESSFHRHIPELDVCVFCDPSMGETIDADDTGIMVTGVDSRNNIFILETVKKRLKPPQLIDELFRIYFQYRPRVIAVEEVNFSGIYKYWMEEKAVALGITLPIRSYKPGSKRSKVSRIRGLTHFFSAGQVYIHENMHAFRDEYEQYPMGTSEHLLDAMAQGPQFWQKGNSEVEVERFAKVVGETFSDTRDIDTGY